MSVLPAMVGGWYTCYEACLLAAANESGTSWLHYDPDITSVEMSPRGELVVRSVTWIAFVELVARGDFNGDGWDDMALLSHYGATEGTFGWANFFVVTRTEKDSVLRVIDAETYLCEDDRCEEEYDYLEGVE